MEKTLWNWDFVPTKLMSVWAVIAETIRSGNRIWIFVQPLLLHYFHSAWLSGPSFPGVLDHVDSFVVLKGVGQEKIALSIILI